MEQKTYRIAPYEKEHWNWFFSTAAVTFLVFCFSEFFWFDMPMWGYALIFAVGALGFGLARIRQRGVELYLSEDGIRVCNGGKETVPFTPWSTFECGYILTLAWHGVKGQHYEDTYFLLSRKALDQETLDQISFDMSNTKPCGIWKDYIASRTSPANNNIIRNDIGSRLNLQERSFDWEANEKAD